MTVGRGDDLDDDFIVDYDIIADSPSVSDFEEHRPALLDDDQPIAGVEVSAGKDAAKQAKKRKRKLKEKERKAKKRKLDVNVEGDAEPRMSIACQTPVLLADLIFASQKKALPKLSSLELDDLHISEEWIADTTSFIEQRTLYALQDFITTTLPTLKVRLAQKPKHKGSPTMIFVAGSALRVVDIVRVMKGLKGEKGGDIAKLFARHFKVEEHVEYLKRTAIGAAVGTPGRLGKLRESGALSLTALTHIILDVSFRDAKKRSIFDIPEANEEIFKNLLADPGILTTLRSGRVKIVLF